MEDYNFNKYVYHYYEISVSCDTFAGPEPYTTQRLQFNTIDAWDPASCPLKTIIGQVQDAHLLLPYL